MERSLTSIGFLSVAIALILAWKYLNWVWLTPKKLERCLREQGFSGNSYRLFSGDWKENSRMLRQANSKSISFSDDITARVMPFQKHCINKYGKNSFVWVGPRPTVHIMNPDHIKDILSNEDTFPKLLVNPIMKYISRGIASHKGQKWARHRKIMKPAFHVETLKQLMPAFCQSCIEMTDEWGNLIHEENKIELDVWPYIQNLTSDIISRTAFGSSYKEGRKIFELQNEIVQILMRERQSVYIPGWRFLPTSTNRRIKEVDKEIETSLRGIINKREEAMKAGKSTNNDLLGVLLESNVIGKQQKCDNNSGMSIADVIEECKLFYFAGQETTSNLLVWAMILLSKYQEWQAAAREEVVQVFGNKMPDFDGLSHLKTVTMIIHEALRLYPPAITTVRHTHKETKLGNLLLPPGVQLYMPIILLHRDSEFWGEDAQEFNPNRFSEGVAKATKGQVCYFPFGWGPRLCIGQNFAMVEAKIALAMILQKFSFELSPSYAHAPIQVLTLNPQHGAHITLHKLM